MELFKNFESYNFILGVNPSDTFVLAKKFTVPILPYKEFNKNLVSPSFANV